MSEKKESKKTTITAEKSRNAVEELKRLIATKYPIVYVTTWEDHRLETILKQVSGKAFSQPIPLFTWTVTHGLRNPEGKRIEDTTTPIKALDHVIHQKRDILLALLERRKRNPHDIDAIVEIFPK